MKSSAKRKPATNSSDNKDKTVRVKKDKMMKSSAKLTTQVISSGSSNIKPTVSSSDNKIAKNIECFQSILICIICGLLGEIKCDQCNSVIFCVKCDNMYHQHQLRSGHTRQKLDFPLSIENEMEDQHIYLETQNLRIEESESKIMNSAAPHSLHQRRAPPPLLLIPTRNVSQPGSSNEQIYNISTGYSENTKINSFDYQEELIESIHSSFQGGHVDFGVAYTNKKGESEDGEILDPDRETEGFSYDVPNHEIETSTCEIQKEEKQAVKNQCRIQPVKRIVRAAKGRNPMNKRLLMKMFATMKAIKKDNNGMKDALTNIKRNQTVLRNKLERTNSEILILKELLYIQTPKQTITIDRTFILPKMPIESALATDNLERKCINETYCDQLAVRFKKLTATDTDDVKPAIKRIMEHIFTYEHLTKYSWSGQSELNSGTEEKKKFSILIGIQSMIRKAATLKIYSTPTVEKDCKKAIKDFVRRASQNYARQNR